MGLTHRLAQIAGGRPEVFDAAPGDRIRYAAMGGVIVSTSAVAAASAIMAVHMTMDLPVVVELLIGLAWGIIILNLDRLLVVQMMRQERKALSVAAALPRLLLALVLGTVISTPVVLQIFAPEIETELIVMQAEQAEAYNRQIAANPDYARIPELTEQIAGDEAVLAKGVSVNVESDPAVTAVRELYDKAQTAYLAAEKNVVCEKEGTCGSGKAGPGIAFDEKVQIRDDRKTERDDAAQQLKDAREAARSNLSTAQDTAITAARSRLDANQATLTTLTERLEAAKRAHAAQSEQDDGLLARLEALDRLSADRPTLQLAHVMLFLLFLCLELLPVMMKLLQVLGPETQYDRKAKEVDDKHARTAAERWDVEREIEQDRLQLIKDASKIGNQKVVEAQSQVMQRVLDAWEDYAHAATDRDVQRWQDQLASAERLGDNETRTVQLRAYPSPGHDSVYWAPDGHETTRPINGPDAPRVIRGTAAAGDSMPPPRRSLYGRPQVTDDPE
ncbi:hypothetical protein FB565_003174 [Actinoplanes lutulentus]|uniref:Uncharacterized protein DUF4407 n=1 Tax=Actinoplanes lutulentus TaxID=1287878 RepID=A0A327YXH6_9ACTN|nr:DUF4407 domain-containing protein [Actinoplanes lutulentus]MBB2943461.1 hypothetical protein [Actinoplanes lutulentus]RAK26020.1 uncharacterized protein DUF4407 [Actinoplanes lutulentus]